jgi:hypothetical protein
MDQHAQAAVSGIDGRAFPAVLVSTITETLAEFY